MLKRFLYYYKPHIRMLTLDMLASLLISVIGMVCPVVTNEGLEKALRKTLPERHHDLIPLNMEAIRAGGEIMEKK